MKRLLSFRCAKGNKSQPVRRLSLPSLALAALAQLASQQLAAQTPSSLSSGITTAEASQAASASASASASAAVEPLPRLAPSKVAAPHAMLPAPTWARLSAAQKTILLPLGTDWDSLDAARKSQWLEVAARFSALPAEEQARAQDRMREWAGLSPAERQQARIGFQGAKKISADERQAKWEAYQALPQEQRQQLADKAARKLATQASKAGTTSAADKTGDKSLAKSNIVPAPALSPAPKAVAPSLLQAKPGATTVLITQSKLAPAHQKAGHTKVLANPDLVDSKTLLPKQALRAPPPQPGTSTP